MALVVPQLCNPICRTIPRCVIILSVNEMPSDPWLDLCKLMRDLSEGRLMEPTYVFKDILDDMRKHGEPSGIQTDLIFDYIRMLGQLARQMQSVTLPELINVHTDYMFLFGKDAPVDLTRFRQILDRTNRLEHLLLTEIHFRLPDEPRLNYPPLPKCLPDEQEPTFAQLKTDFAAQTQLLMSYVNAFHADRPLGKTESSSLDTRTLANLLTFKLWEDELEWLPEDQMKDAQRDFKLSVERQKALNSTVRNLLAEAVAYARRHGSVHLSTCCDLLLEFDAGNRHDNLVKRLKETLDDLCQEAATRGKVPGNGAGRKTTTARKDQIEKGVEKKRANPSRSSLGIARDVLMLWEKVYGEASARQGYSNDEKGIKLLAGQIDRFLKKRG